MESKKDEESLELGILNLNINSTREAKAFAEETSFGEQENKGSQEFGTAILKTSDERILALEEGIKILSEMTKRSSEEHRRLVDEHTKLISMFSDRGVENAKEIRQLKAEVETLDTCLKDVTTFAHSNLNDRITRLEKEETRHDNRLNHLRQDVDNLDKHAAENLDRIFALEYEVGKIKRDGIRPSEDILIDDDDEQSDVDSSSVYPDNDEKVTRRDSKLSVSEIPLVPMALGLL